MKYLYNLHNSHNQFSSYNSCNLNNSCTKRRTFFIIFFPHIQVKSNYYQKHNERFPKEVRERYQNLSEEEKGNRQKKRLEKDIKILLKKKKGVIRNFLRNKS